MQDTDLNNSPSRFLPLLIHQSLLLSAAFTNIVAPCSACTMLASTARFEKLLDDLPKHVARVNGLNKNLGQFGSSKC